MSSPRARSKQSWRSGACIHLFQTLSTVSVSIHMSAFPVVSRRAMQSAYASAWRGLLRVALSWEWATARV
eukprot:3890479-Amphidinium_carterae.1